MVILSPTAKVVLSIVLLIILSIIGYLINQYAYMDFSKIKFSLKQQEIETEKEKDATATESVKIDDQELRERILNQVRANQYYEMAKRDYFYGNYDEAIRRLERAKWYDPSNYNVFRLCGQIYFEKSQYRKAFNEWARASQLPNYEQSLLRDLDVLKRLIRYCRNEIEKLKYIVNRNPEDRLSYARLKEFEDRLKE